MGNSRDHVVGLQKGVACAQIEGDSKPNEVRASFDTLLGLSMRLSHASYRDLVVQTA